MTAPITPEQSAAWFAAKGEARENDDYDPDSDPDLWDRDRLDDR